jgi:hypothetical protein
MHNAPFRRALLSLSHPVSIAAIIVVLLNDHWWRRVAPSWFTGKIGDFAWLIFAPFLLAVILAWLLPRREKLVSYTAIIGVGLIFGLAKTIPAFHALTIDVLEVLTGWPNVLQMDPTDLLALPALLIAWWIWKQSTTRSIRLPDRGWVLLPLAVFATMADSAQPNPGIACVQPVDGQILAYDVYYGNGVYISRDGGLSWIPGTKGTATDTCRGSSKEMISPQNPLVHFRLNGRQIERSDDGGSTWQTEYGTAMLTEAQMVYAQRSEGSGNLDFSGSLVAVMDAATGNLIVGAGHQGVIVRTPDEAWHAIAVGRYNPLDLHRPEAVLNLLAQEALLALVVFVLSVGTIAPGRTSIIMRVALGLAWLGLIGTLIVAENLLHSSYSQLSIGGTIVTAVIAFPIAVIRLTAAFRLNPKTAWLTLGLSALTALIFMVPFVVWSQNGIPDYAAAAAYALVLAAITCFVGQRYLRRYIINPLQNLTA